MTKRVERTAHILTLCFPKQLNNFFKSTHTLPKTLITLIVYTS